MFSLSLRGFSPGTPVSSHCQDMQARLTGESTLSVGMSVRGNGMSPCDGLETCPGWEILPHPKHGGKGSSCPVTLTGNSQVG